MVNMIVHFLASYGYGSPKMFLLSLCPSFKYDLQVPALILSTVSAFIAQWLGLTPLLAVAMLVAISVEMISGCKASRKRGEHFESFKFSRCILKLTMWLAIIFIIHSFYRECANSGEILYQLSALFFSVVKLFVMIWFVVEHVTSILENLAEIDGKPKDALILKIGGAWDNITDLFKSKLK